MTISRIATVPVIISNGNNSSAVPINHWNQLRLSTYFDNYAPMYDQMKINKIRMKVTGNQSGTAQTANLSPAVVLAFDRNGLSPNQTVNTGTISTYSSAQLKQWSTGNAFVMYQTIYPSTIMEKGQYVPTDSLLDPETTEGQVSTNPSYNLADPTLPFKPISMLGVDLGITAASDQTFAFTVEYEYTVTFRGMRKPSLSSSSRLVPLNYHITANGNYSVSPGLYNAEGFSDVNLTVDVTPQPADIDFDAISIYYREGINGNLALIDTISYDDSRWTVSSGYDIVIPAGYTLIMCQNDYVSTGTNFLSRVYVWVNASSAPITISDSPGNVCMTFPTYSVFNSNTSYIFSLNQDNDPKAYSTYSAVLGTSSRSVSIITDAEDLDLFLNRR